MMYSILCNILPTCLAELQYGHAFTAHVIKKIMHWIDQQIFVTWYYKSRYTRAHSCSGHDASTTVSFHLLQYDSDASHSSEGWMMWLSYQDTPISK